jgi:hypothetical protein
LEHIHPELSKESALIDSDATLINSSEEVITFPTISREDKSNSTIDTLLPESNFPAEIINNLSFGFFCPLGYVKASGLKNDIKGHIKSI